MIKLIRIFFLERKLQYGSTDERRNAVSTLGDIRSERAAEAILRHWKFHQDDEWGQKLSLSRLGRFAVRPLIRAWHSNSHVWGSRVPYILGTIKDPRVVPALLDAATYKVKLDRGDREALEVLGTLGDESAIPVLVTRSFTLDDWAVYRHIAVTALVRLVGAQRARNLLTEYAQTKKLEREHSFERALSKLAEIEREGIERERQRVANGDAAFKFDFNYQIQEPKKGYWRRLWS